MRQTKKTVYVAMSGGVDSSVAAALLKKQGFSVVGVFMKPWQPKSIHCLWQKDREDAIRVASVLDIPLLTWDFSEEYGKKVAEYMIESYRLGFTPNPDVMCNKEIKFGLFFKKAVSKGADYIATGHYAQIRDGRLYTAKDKNKDQTYFLWTLTSEQLTKILFPVGNYIKPEVRKLAKKLKLPVFDKKDSQGVCFVGPLDMKSFLRRYIKSKLGKILDISGKSIGTHDGVQYYTIGQRHGLDIKLGKGPYYIISKNLKKNTITVGAKKDMVNACAYLKDVHFISEPPKFPMKLQIKIRYRTKAEPAILYEDGEVRFVHPLRAVTAGQSAVFYRGSTVVGGGIIS